MFSVPSVRNILLVGGELSLRVLRALSRYLFGAGSSLCFDVRNILLIGWLVDQEDLIIEI